MARGLGRGGRPLGNTHEDGEPEATPMFEVSEAEVVKHNAAIDAIEWARNPRNPAYNTPGADTIVRAVSGNLIHGSMERL